MKISIKLAVVAAALFGMCGYSQAQALKTKNAAPAAQPTPVPTAGPAEGANTSAPPGWVARCSSASRGAPLECAIEQSAVLTKTGQLIVLINIRVSAETRTPVGIVQLPLGLNLPAGAKLQVDDGMTSDLQVQTCEARGCYANAQISPDMLAALKSGKQLKVSFQNMAKETITIPMPLADFSAAYEKIK
ncbi:invasion protein IalB [Bradyrhizobium sp. AZCC 1588]|uniref:invasion associated locus B family protein n=1 Tax=unclassified Bradyrhizobium TaxID=2631580 RepID=UPI00306557ED